MTLEQFVAEEITDVKRFAKAWVKSNGQTPDRYPMDMEAGEWSEQFIAYGTERETP